MFLNLWLLFEKVKTSSICSLEGFVDWPVPAEEGTGRKEDEPEDGEAKVHPVGSRRGEAGETRQHVQEQRHAVDCKEEERDELGSVTAKALSECHLHENLTRGKLGTFF